LPRHLPADRDLPPPHGPGPGDPDRHRGGDHRGHDHPAADDAGEAARRLRGRRDREPPRLHGRLGPPQGQRPRGQDRAVQGSVRQLRRTGRPPHRTRDRPGSRAMRPVRALAAVLASVALVLGLAACTEDDASPLARVEVTGACDRRPQVIAPTPLIIDAPETATIIEGDGRELAEGDAVLVAYLAIDAQTGETIDDAYTREPRALLLSRSEAGPLYDSLLGAHEGT